MKFILKNLQKISWLIDRLIEIKPHQRHKTKFRYHSSLSQKFIIDKLTKRSVIKCFFVIDIVIEKLYPFFHGILRMPNNREGNKSQATLSFTDVSLD